jgi:hypothetical protein
MNGRVTFTIGLFAALCGLTLLAVSLFITTPAYAQTPDPEVDNGNCITCHEDLYFNHDTGNWFCIREAPMRCVDCHGGDPTATTQEEAHYDRSAHPVVNEDISRCRECHTDPDECCECVSKFDQVAGINEVRLVSPAPISNAPDLTNGLPAIEKQEPINWLLILEVLPLVVIVSLALSIYVAYKIKHALPTENINENRNSH